jgi:hypothetical protein
MDGIEAYLRDVKLRPESPIILSASGWDARTSRSVEARGQEERGEDGHPVGTRVSLTFRVTGGLVSGTSSSSAVLTSDTSSSSYQIFTVYLPMTEVGAHVSDRIVDDMKFTAGLVVETCAPPSVSGFRRR